MARTIVEVPLRQDPRAADAVARSVLAAEGYHEMSYNNNTELVWKMGTGVMTAMHYIKLEYTASAMRISGWVQIGVGSVGGKERDLKGFVGAIPKKSVLNTIEKIKAALA